MRTIILILGLFTFSAEARMYQWLDPDTGTTQLSGKPPSWYRSGQSGPRIFVFDAGKIIDDTGITVSEEHRTLLRQRAYDIADEESIRARAKAVQAMKEKQLAEELLAEEEEFVEEEEMVAEADTRERESIVKVEEKDVSELTLDDMKKLIQDWETQQESKAKEIINQ